TASRGIALGALAADCAPILFADANAGVIGAAHSGWPGSLAGIAEATIGAMENLGAERSAIRAVIGPCIAQTSYQVGSEFYDRFVQAAAGNADFFVADRVEGKFRFDLPGFVMAGLRAAGLTEIAWEGSDTVSNPDRFFSYRRATLEGEADYGRGLSAIALV
ncbi:MAG: polyphenol oxidase family protein, partial [Pseudomonadota bacterium]